MISGIRRLAARRRLRSFHEKNADEFQAMLRLRMPNFVLPPPIGRRPRLPVFVFHTVEPEILDIQLRYLRDNGYRTMRAVAARDALRRKSVPSDAVMLTFDDATSTFWTYALPLLRRYEMNAVLFAIPGIVPDGDSVRPNLDDAWIGRLALSDLETSTKTSPLCTWPELLAIQRSGIVDIQSHSLTHSRIPISCAVIDVQSPDYPVGTYANSDLPVSTLDNEEIPERLLRLGAPVFRYASRLSNHRRFIHDPGREQAMIDFVEKNGGRSFFQSADWRKQWFRRFGGNEARFGRFENAREQREAIERELYRSRVMLERKLPGNEVRHLCLPWFAGGTIAERAAEAAGYDAMYFGANCSSTASSTMVHIQRVSEHYCMRLPGRGRIGFGDVWTSRLTKRQKN